MVKERGKRNWLLTVGILAVGVAVGVWWFSPVQQQRRRNAALIEAARLGDVNAVEAALDDGADVNTRDGDGITPLMHAVRGERSKTANPDSPHHLEVVDLLLKRGAEVNAKTESGFVALFWAARYGHAGAAKLLILHGADVNAKDSNGITALHWATTNKQDKVADLLKEAGAE